MSPVQRLRPEGLVASPAFSHVAVVPPGATTIYVGGQNAVDAEGSLVGKDDVAMQSSRALENAKTALAAAGATISDVVQWTVLFVAGADIGAGYRAIASELAADEPALVTAALVAGLGVPGALVEISAVAAVLPESL
jgi:enamine deaminase RidA (YjgF/YER057c/UK114 family)